MRVIDYALLHRADLVSTGSNVHEIANLKAVYVSALDFIESINPDEVTDEHLELFDDAERQLRKKVC